MSAKLNIATAPNELLGRAFGSEIDITPEMIEAGAAIISDRLEKPLDWITEDLARDAYVAMAKAKAVQ
jgi:hypothetical protein